MRRTPAGAGINNLGDRMGGKRTFSRSSTYSEDREMSKKEKDAQDILKYGGTGAGKKFLYGLTSGLIGEKAASGIAGKFANKEQQEEAYKFLNPNRNSGSSRGRSDNSAIKDAAIGIRKTERLIRGISKEIQSMTNRFDDMEDHFDNIDSKISQVKVTVDRIGGEVLPREITIGEGKKAQTFEYSPLAPEGKQVREKGAGARYASKEGGGRSDYSRILNKAAQASFSTLKMTPDEVKGFKEEKKSKSKKIKLTKEEAVGLAKELAEEIAIELKGKLKVESANVASSTTTTVPKESRPDTGPQSYKEYSQQKKDLGEAQDVLKYGSKGGGRKFLYGLTSGLVGEKAASKVAEKFGNKEQQEKAFQTIKKIDDSRKGITPAIPGTVPPTMSAEPTNQTVPPAADNDTATQNEAEKGAAEAASRESEESSSTDRKGILKKLDDIISKLEGKEGGGGGIFDTLLKMIGMAIPIMEGIAAAATALLPALAVVGAAIAGAAVGTVIKKGLDWAAEKTTGEGGLGQAIYAKTHDEKGAQLESAKNAGAATSEEDAIKMGRASWVDPENPNLYHTVPKNKRVGPAYDKKLGIPSGPTAEAAATPTATPPAPLTSTQNEVVQVSNENASLKEEQEQKVVIVNNAPVINQAAPQPRQQPATPGIISIRNSELSVSTYTASIFDHPVVHPGIYKM